MKFGEDLTSHLTPEWRKQYLSYEELKTMIYDAIENAPAEDADPAARDRYLLQADEKFFAAIAIELRKVELFYNEKLADSLRKLHELQRELEEFEKSSANVQREKRLKKEGKNNDSAKKAPGEEQRQGLLQGIMPLGKNTTRVVEKQHSKTLSQIKFAFSEFYLSLTLLNNFQVMNRTGFRKILKKHDKLYHNSKGGEYFSSKVEKSKFVIDKETERLIELVEKLVTERLEKGDRTTAMKKLRVPPLSEQQSAWTTFRLGFFLGCFIVLVLIVIMLWASSANTRPREPKWVAVRLFRGFLVLFFNIWLMGANVWGWQRYGVNHVLIFEIDPRNHLTYQSLMEMASMFCVTWALCVLAYLYIPMVSPNVSPFIFPLVLMVFCIFWMINPLKKPDMVLHRSSRYWFLKHVFRCFTAPFHHVTFADFWLGDQMNSLATFFLDMEYFACFYAFEVTWDADHFLRPIERQRDHNITLSAGIDFETGQDMCQSNIYGIRPFVSLIPASVRFFQCLRRYRDSGKVHPHLVNAGKYSTTYFVIALGVANSWFKHKDGGNTDNVESPFFYFWVMSYIISFAYTFIWDVWMDWSLMDPKAKTPFLRDELIYGHSSYYYFAIANDFVLRLGWVLNVSLGDVWNDHVDLMGCLTSLLECWRRFVWNFLRLENEHVNNCGQFRAVRDISLKPIKKGDLEYLLDRVIKDEGVTHRGDQLKEKPVNLKAKRNNMTGHPDYYWRRRRPSPYSLFPIPQILIGDHDGDVATARPVRGVQKFNLFRKMSAPKLAHLGGNFSHSAAAQMMMNPAHYNTVSGGISSPKPGTSAASTKERIELRPSAEAIFNRSTKTATEKKESETGTATESNRADEASRTQSGDDVVTAPLIHRRNRHESK